MNRTQHKQGQMAPARWRRIKAMRVEPRMFHQTSTIERVMGKDGVVRSEAVPTFRGTYNVGNNAAKRARREVHGVRK